MPEITVITYTTVNWGRTVGNKSQKPIAAASLERVYRFRNP